MSKRDEYLKEIKELFESGEDVYVDDSAVENTVFYDDVSDAETKAKDVTYSGNKKIKSTSVSKNIHEGHRKRMQESVDSDPDFVTFSDHEILEYILFSTIPRIDTNPLAHKLINTFGSFSSVLNATIPELMRVKGVSFATARSISMIIPAARRAEISRIRSRAYLDTAENAARYLAPYFFNRNCEFIYIVCLDNSDKVINVELIAEGHNNFAVFDLKKIVESACRMSAVKLILAHNHPGGSLEPSLDDINVTQQVGIALASIGVILSDHLIFTASDYYSFYMSKRLDDVYSYCDKMLGTRLVEELRARRSPYTGGRYLMQGRKSIGEDPDDYKNIDDAVLNNGELKK